MRLTKSSHLSEAGPMEHPGKASWWTELSR